MSDLRTSTPGMDAWRPQGDHLTYGEAAWLGAAWGLAGHATLHLFSAFMPELAVLLAPFRPAENFAAVVAGEAAPLARWFMLLLSQAFFWATAACGLLAAVREVASAVVHRRQPHAAA